MTAPFQNITRVLDDLETKGILYQAVPVIEMKLLEMVLSQRLSIAEAQSFVDYAQSRYQINVRLDPRILPKPDTKVLSVNVLEHESGKRIKIYEMTHVAPLSFYDKCQCAWARDAKEGYEIHIEGVRGAPSYLQQAYCGMAKMLGKGWGTQPKPRVSWVNYDLALSEMPWHSRMFIKTFSPLMNMVVDQLASASEDKKKAFREKGRKALLTSNDSEQSFGQRLLGVLLGNNRRNHYAIKHALATANDVSLVWGAAHAKGMIKLLEKQGYSLLGN